MTSRSFNTCLNTMILAPFGRVNCSQMVRMDKMVWCTFCVLAAKPTKLLFSKNCNNIADSVYNRFGDCRRKSLTEKTILFNALRMRVNSVICSVIVPCSSLSPFSIAWRRRRCNSTNAACVSATASTMMSWVDEMNLRLYLIKRPWNCRYYLAWWKWTLHQCICSWMYCQKLQCWTLILTQSMLTTSTYWWHLSLPDLNL